MSEAIPASLPEAITEEIKRVQADVLPAYEEIGQAGTFGRMSIQDRIRKAERARDSGDAVAMVANIQALRDIEL